MTANFKCSLEQRRHLRKPCCRVAPS